MKKRTFEELQDDITVQLHRRPEVKSTFWDNFNEVFENIGVDDCPSGVDSYQNLMIDMEKIKVMVELLGKSNFKYFVPEAPKTLGFDGAIENSIQMIEEFKEHKEKTIGIYA